MLSKFLLPLSASIRLTIKRQAHNTTTVLTFYGITLAMEPYGV
jgi:hypothetical protein